jgi:hypothetical protein
MPSDGLIPSDFPLSGFCTCGQPIERKAWRDDWAHRDPDASPPDEPTEDWGRLQVFPSRGAREGRQRSNGVLGVSMRGSHRPNRYSQSRRACAASCMLACHEGDSMSRSMVGLLAAVATAMPALVPFVHGLLILVIILEAAAAAGLVAICTAPAQSPAAGTMLPVSQKTRLRLRIDNLYCVPGSCPTGIVPNGWWDSRYPPGG